MPIKSKQQISVLPFDLYLTAIVIDIALTFAQVTDTTACLISILLNEKDKNVPYKNCLSDKRPILIILEKCINSVFFHAIFPKQLLLVLRLSINICKNVTWLIIIDDYDILNITD